MRVTNCAIALGVLTAADAASAMTIIVYTDPMTLARRTVILDTPGPDRAFMCMAPPAEAACRSIPIKRK
jgi:hypothetical protein